MSKITTYREAEEYVLSIPQFTQKNTWEQTRDFYEFLGKPGQRSRIIHVAGTNGKGSVCAYMDSCLREGGYSVGMFTSPHLISVRERIRLNGEVISQTDFLQTLLELKERLREYRRKLTDKGKKYHPAFFEWLFFMNMLYAERNSPQVIILETGLGGRLDATNVIDFPAACVITPVSLDHMEYLGDTCEQIAKEKAGIIKQGSRVIYSAMRRECEKVISRKATECGCSCRKVTKGQEMGFNLKHKGIDFSFYSRYYGYIPMSLTTKALYQTENAALALVALEEAGFDLSPETMQRGVMNCCWEGRMEEISPGIFLDGAHNRDGIEAFLETVERDGCQGERWLLFSVVSDKEYDRMTAQITDAGLFQRICTAPLENVRGLGQEQLEVLFAGDKVRVFENVPRALEEICALRGEKDIVYVAGSLYLVGQVRACFTGGSNSQ